MRCLIIRADVNGTRLDPPRVVQRSALGSCDCRYAGRRIPPRRAPSICTEGRKALEPLQAARGPQRALEPSPNPICVQNVKITPNAK